MQQVIFIADLIVCSTCFRHHYAHHQELESIIQIVAACGIWCFGFQVVGMVWSWRLCVRFAGCPHQIPQADNHMYNTIELLMMGIMVPETCLTSNKICNKNHLLHLVGILFPHTNADARSKSLQICITILRKFHEFRMTFAPFEVVSGSSIYTYVSCELPGVLNMKLLLKSFRRKWNTT
jgi:hypothetical protein